MRQYIGRTDFTDARWGEGRDLEPTPPVTDSGIQSPAGSSIDPKPFRYSRKIPESPAGLTALLLDAAVLAHSRPDLADLRIVDNSNRQIPYLLERRQDVLALNLMFLPEKAAPSATQSHYQIALPFENLPPAKLVVTTNERLFQRKISVQVKQPTSDPRSDPTLETVASASWRHNDPDIPAPPLTLDLRSSSERRRLP